jgi:hypothetical protein
MTDLPMPSEVRKAAAADAAVVSTTPFSLSPDAAAAGNAGEPPSAKLIVRLFVIPLFIVAAAVGVMFLIGLLTGGAPTFEESLKGLEEPGGQRTGGLLIGPGSKQRYMYAQKLAEGMKEKMRAGMAETDRTQLANRLLGVVDKAQADEGEVKHFLLLALGRVWQVDPRQGPMDSEAAVASRGQVVAKLLGYAEAAPVSASTEDDRVQLKALQNRVRNAAVLGLAFMSGRPEARAALPSLVRILGDTSDDLDVRMSASAAIGQLATPQDTVALEALRTAKNRTDKKEEVELVWSGAIALAQLNQTDAEGEVLKLLSRAELDQVDYFDRETDPKNPRFRKLSEPEKERILINAMIGGVRLQSPEVQAQIRKVADADSSARVREAGRLVLAGKDAGLAAAALKPPAN